MYHIIHYLDLHGKDHYQEWLHKSVRGGIQELRIDIGLGYRIYYAFVDHTVILLTCGGNKQSQDRDITSAIEMLHDWKKRNGKNSPHS